MPGTLFLRDQLPELIEGTKNDREREFLIRLLRRLKGITDETVYPYADRIAKVYLSWHNEVLGEDDRNAKVTRIWEEIDSARPDNLDLDDWTRRFEEAITDIVAEFNPGDTLPQVRQDKRSFGMNAYGYS